MADPLAQFSPGRVMEDSRDADEEELRRLRAMQRQEHGAATLTEQRQAFLRAQPHTSAAEEDPELEAELAAAATPAPTAGRLVVEGDDLLEGPDNPWSHASAAQDRGG